VSLSEPSQTAMPSTKSVKNMILVYHHFGQSYMSQVTTVKNRILFLQTCEEYDLGRIRSYKALLY